MAGRMTSKAAKLTRRHLMLGAAAVFSAPMINRGVFAASDGTTYSARTLALMERALVIDMLGLITVNPAQQTQWLGSAAGMTDADKAMFKSSGIHCLHHAYSFNGPGAKNAVLDYLAAWNGFIAHNGDLFMPAVTAADIEQAKSANKIAVLMGVQNADHFQQTGDVQYFYNLGQSCAQLTYNAQNYVGSGAMERVDGGLSDYGVAVVQAMNEAGMLVDVTHCGDRTTLDAIALSADPIAISHANCRALNDGPRLKSDEAIRKLAAKGGVMGISGMRHLVRHREPTTVDHIVDHIDHVVKIAGIDHVGIGSDADLMGFDVLPADHRAMLRQHSKDRAELREKFDTDGFNHPRKMFDLTEALIRRGYTDNHIEAILGGNFKRLLATVIG